MRLASGQSKGSSHEFWALALDIALGAGGYPRRIIEIYMVRAPVARCFSRSCAKKVVSQPLSMLSML